MSQSFKPSLNIGLLMMLALLFMLAPAVLAQDGTPEPAQPSAERPLIFIRSSWVEPAVLAPGQMGRLYLELHNVGDATAA